MTRAPGHFLDGWAVIFPTLHLAQALCYRSQLKSISQGRKLFASVPLPHVGRCEISQCLIWVCPRLQQGSLAAFPAGRAHGIAKNRGQSGIADHGIWAHFPNGASWACGAVRALRGLGSRGSVRDMGVMGALRCRGSVGYRVSEGYGSYRGSEGFEV